MSNNGTAKPGSAGILPAQIAFKQSKKNSHYIQTYSPEIFIRAVALNAGKMPALPREDL